MDVVAPGTRPSLSAQPTSSRSSTLSFLLTSFYLSLLESRVYTLSFPGAMRQTINCGVQN